MTPHLRPCQLADLLRCVNRDGVQGADPQMAAHQLTAGPAFSAWEGERLVGCAGVGLLWPGVGHAWMVLPEAINGHGLWLTRAVARILGDIERAYGLHRLEATCLTDSPRNQKWLEVMGFHVEQAGTARKYLIDGRSVLRYERVRD